MSGGFGKASFGASNFGSTGIAAGVSYLNLLNGIDLCEFPIADAEFLAIQFESIRRHIWILNHLSAGSSLRDYSDGMTLVEWQAFIDTFDVDAPCFPANAGESTFKNLLFTRPVIGGNWLCTFIGLDYTKSDMRGAFPFDTNGTLRSMWAYGVDGNRYSDWDENANRRDAYQDTKPGSAGSWTMHARSCDWMPKQVLAGKQEFPIKYTNTGRVILHRVLSVETARMYITHPDTLGPNFEIVAWKRPNSNTTICTKVIDEKEIGLTGYQYGVSNGHPYDDGGNDQEDISPFTDPKVRPAYQNQVERICCLANFMWPTSGGTAWGNQFKDNYVRINWDAGEAFYVPIPGPPPVWSSGTTYVFGMKVRYGDTLWLARQTNQGVTPTHGNDWQWMSEIPDYAPLNHECWGCNESGFELMVWIIGKYDWYFCTQFPYVRQAILKERYDLLNVGGLTEEEVNAEYPVPEGTWRRTWRYTMGAPKDNIDLMWPTSKGVPPHTDQDSYPGTGIVPWIGMFNDSIPTITLTENELNEILDRHGPVVVHDVEQYELHNSIINDMKAVLNNLKYNLSSAVLKTYVRTGADSGNEYDDSLGSWQYAQCRALAEAAAWSETAGGLSLGVLFSASYILGSSWYWSSSTGLYQAKMVVSGGFPDGRLMAIRAGVLFKMTGSEYYGNMKYSEPHPVTVLLPDGSTETIQMYDGAIGELPESTQKYKFVSFPMLVSLNEDLDIPVNMYGATPAPNFPWVSTPGTTEDGYMVSWGHLQIENLSGFEGLVLTLQLSLVPASVWAKYKHPTPDDVAVDDVHFNSEGVYIKD